MLSALRLCLTVQRDPFPPKYVFLLPLLFASLKHDGSPVAVRGGTVRGGTGIVISDTSSSIEWSVLVQAKRMRRSGCIVEGSRSFGAHNCGIVRQCTGESRYFFNKRVAFACL